MKIGIIGLGLIGGSIFKDLKRLGHDVIAISQSQDGECIYKTYDYLKNCNIIFVCTAMNKTVSVLDEIERYVSKDTIVADVCSLKSFVCKKFRPYIFIPTHPMAGTENKGFESSLEGLFKDATWVLTPFKTTPEDAVKKLTDIIKQLGANPLFTTPQKHDEAAAMISHMPMLISQALFLAASENPLAMEMASSGFRDMTRLAMSNEEMAKDMVEMNHKNIENSVLKLYKAVGELTSGDYAELIKQIKTRRSKMFTK